MKLSKQQFRDGGAIPGYCAFAVQDPKSHIRPSQNRNPHLAWTDLPKARDRWCSSATIRRAFQACDVNLEGRTIPGSLPRVASVTGC